MSGLAVLGPPVVWAPETPATPPPAYVPPPRLVVGCTLESRGGRIDLMASPYRLKDPILGCSGSDGDLDITELPGIDGGYVVGSDDPSAGLVFGEARPTLTVQIMRTNALDNGVAVGRLRTVLNARRYGPATLTFTRGDGARRALSVRLEAKAGDFDLPQRAGLVNPDRAVVLRLVGTDPLWRGTSGRAGPWGIGPEVTPMLPWRYPWRVGSSTVLGQANQIIVRGDELTYPVLRIEGPITGSTEVIHEVHGVERGYLLDRGVGTGQVVTINHHPLGNLGGRRQVAGPDGTSWREYVAAGADFFELRPNAPTAPGENPWPAQSIKVTMTGATAGASAWLDWETLYWSAFES